MEQEYIEVGEYKFEIVDHVPAGYVIWNIGQNMPDGYLPITETMIENKYHINPNTLKAIKFEGAQAILSATILGPNTVKKAERYIARHEHQKNYQWRVGKMKAALPLMKQIKGL